MKNLEDLKKIRQEAKKGLCLNGCIDGYRIVVGMATCGIAAGAKPVMDALNAEVKKRNLKKVSIKQVGCIGECALEPIVEVYDTKGMRTTYCKVTPKLAEKIIEEHIINGLIIDELLIANHRK